jgi:hypothetical protein
MRPWLALPSVVTRSDRARAVKPHPLTEDVHGSGNKEEMDLA